MLLKVRTAQVNRAKTRDYARLFTETPKALANLSPGLERSDNPGDKH